jgi:hypothetical protein
MNLQSQNTEQSSTGAVNVSENWIHTWQQNIEHCPIANMGSGFEHVN